MKGLDPNGVLMEHGADELRHRFDQAASFAPDGAELLDETYAFLGRFVAYPSEDAQIAHALWVFHAHLMQVWDSTPRLAALSPEPGSGKTRLLEVTELLVPNPVESVNVSPAYLFRKVADPNGLPTILFDEIDTVFGPKAKDNEEIRGLLNAGHRRGATAGRCVIKGKTVETEEIPAYCAVALAGIGNLPDTILSRSVIIRMRRRSPTEKVQQFRRRVHLKAGHQLRDRIAAWAASVAGDIVWPQMPPGIEDRNADVWEPLLAVADAAGGRWPDRSRVSAVTLVTLSRQANPSLGIRLLGDVKRVWGSGDSLSTEVILQRLNALDDAPWGDLKGGLLNDRGLAKFLRQYDVKPRTIRVGESTAKGYRREDLHDPWSRYLEPQSH
jgi:hypothetical protein